MEEVTEVTSKKFIFMTIRDKKRISKVTNTIPLFWKKQKGDFTILCII